MRPGVDASTCLRCGARRVDLQIGLEQNPGEYVEKIVAIFREVRRVLAAHGTVWCNLGDSYMSRPYEQWGLKPKDQAGIPHRVYFALQADGWYGRIDNVWEKTNVMPESIKDRPTKSHEYVFLLSKQPQYFFDQEAVREPYITPLSRWGGPKITGEQQAKSPRGLAYDRDLRPNPEGRNIRSVWEIPTENYSEAHFACVDEETECLTDTGWKNHRDLQIGELAAQFDLVSRKLSWAGVEDVARYQVVDQDMISAHSRDMSVLLTPNHRCVIQRRHHRTRSLNPPEIVRADELRSSHSIPTTAEWDFVGDTSLSLEWAELLGWYIAEGHQSKQTLAVEIYQSETANPEKVLRIESLLRQVGAEWTSARAKRLWRGNETIAVSFRVLGYAATRLRELAPDKKIPTSSLLWSQDRIEALMRGLIGGDGHVRHDGRSCFVQSDREQAGLVQALAIRLGQSATLSERMVPGYYVVYITKHKTRSFRGTNGKGVDIEKNSYTGTVWCPKLPCGTFVARRKGRVFITGNTFPTKLVEKALLAGCPSRVCNTCGKPSERIVVEAHNPYPGSTHDHTKDLVGQGAQRHKSGVPSGTISSKRFYERGPNETVGWTDCEHNNWRAGIVLDPFGGSGTTALVARNHQRHAILIELSKDYCRLAAQRLQQLSLFTETQ